MELLLHQPCLFVSLKFDCKGYDLTERDIIVGGGAGGWKPRRTGGRRGTGDGRRKGGKQEGNSKRQAFVIWYCLSSSQRNKPNNVSWLPFNLLQGLKQNFICEKSQTRKFVLATTKKKQHYFGWSWKSLIQAAYITGHEWDSMTHVQVCRLCQSCQCLSSVSLQPVAKMMRHSHAKTTFLTSNRSWSQVCKI